ncbi:hypothetical protein [Weissella minor]|uniref:hypothetical protein n=1 Tax=Weissella minor TaxID=1620 RepID=UPI003AF208BB
MRKIIFIGKNGINNIYLNTKTRKIYRKKSNRILDMDRTKNNSKHIIVILMSLLLIAWIMSITASHVKLQFSVYTRTTLFMIGIVWVIECISLIYIVEAAMYGGLKPSSRKYELSNNKQEFREAIMTNNFWNMFNDKKVTFLKKVIVSVLILVITLTALGMCMVFSPDRNIGLIDRKIGSEIFVISLAGFLQGIMVIMIWINNPLRWLIVVEKYQTRKLWRK